MVSPSPAAGTAPPSDSDVGAQLPHSADTREDKPDPWAPLLLQVDELREYFSYYLGARTDLVRRRIRRIVIATLLGFVGAVAAATFAATAAALMLIGLGQGLGELLGGRIWLGNVLAGAVVLALVALGGLLAARWLNHSSRIRTIRSYAQRRERQRRRVRPGCLEPEPAPAETETEFLAQQAAEARAAMGATLGDIGQNLNQAWVQATDVRGLIGRHPWWALGAAAAAGLAAGMTLAPGSRKHAPRSAPRESFEAEERTERSRPSRLASLIPWEMLIGPITELVRTLVENLFAAVVASRAAAQAATEAPASGSPGNKTQAAASSPGSASPLDDPLVEQAIEA